jgi:hypothetical protein
MIRKDACQGHYRAVWFNSQAFLIFRWCNSIYFKLQCILANHLIIIDLFCI